MEYLSVAEFAQGAYGAKLLCEWEIGRGFPGGEDLEYPVRCHFARERKATSRIGIA